MSIIGLTKLYIYCFRLKSICHQHTHLELNIHNILILLALVTDQNKNYLFNKFIDASNNTYCFHHKVKQPEKLLLNKLYYKFLFYSNTITLLKDIGNIM